MMKENRKQRSDYISDVSKDDLMRCTQHVCPILKTTIK
jgi:hypothetical protein